MYIKSLFRRFFNVFRRIPSEIYVFLAAFVYRLPALGYDFINNDAFHWKERGYAFGSALTSLNFAETAVTYHPGVPLLWCQFLAIKIYSMLVDLGVYKNLSGRHEFLVNNQIQTTVVVFLTSVLIAIAYRQLKRILGFRLALLSIILILIEPFYLALSRTIHTDAIISLFMFISILYFYIYLGHDGYTSENNKKIVNYDAVFAGIFAGLAFLTKSSALFLIPFFILIAGIYFLKFKNNLYAKKTLIVLGFAIASFFIFWPAMWVQPIESLNLYLFKGVQGIAIEEGHEHIWFGKVTADPGPLFYPVVLISRYSIILIISFLVSIYFLAKNKSDLFKKNNIDLFLILFLFSIFYILMITLVSKKLDRYSLPIIFPLGVLSAWAVSLIFNKRIAVLLIGLLVIFRCLLFYGLHPNYLAYYSPIIGGVEGGRYIIEPKWLVGYDKIAEYFNKEQKGQKETIKVAIADFDYLRPFAEFEVVNIRNESERAEADYFVLPVFREERNSFYTDSHETEKLPDTIKIAGVDYYYIHKVKKSN